MPASLQVISFIIIWWSCFLFYPLWYVPHAPGLRMYIAVGLMFAGILFGYSFRLLSSEKSNQLTTNNDSRFWFILISVVFCLHIPFLNLPVITGLDMIDHASVPALVASKIINPVSSLLHFPLSFILSPLFCMLILVLCFISSLRQRLYFSLCRYADECVKRLWIVYMVLVVVTAAYLWVIIHFAVPDRFGDIETIFRYQPISKMMLIPLYLIFGIHEWVGRALQLLFFAGGAYYVYQTTLLFGSIHSARLAAILFLLLPPLFHYGNTHLIEGGSLFFITAAFFYWIRYWEKQNRDDLMIGSWFAALGCLYKHTNIIVVPAFAVMWVWFLLKYKSKKSWQTYGLEIMANSIPAFTFILYLKLSSFSSDTPSQMAFPSIARMIENGMAIPQGVTFPVFIVLLAGSIFIIASRHPFSIYWISWVIPHFILTVMSMAFMNVRQALPYYLGMLVAASLFLSWIFHTKPLLRNTVMYLLIPAYLVCVCLFYPYQHKPQEWGRAMGDRSYINLTNWDQTYIPYHIIIPDLLKRTSPSDAIFAPMGNDSSQFYLAKYHWGGERFYERHLFTAEGEVVFQSIEKLKEVCQNSNFEWLLLPRGKWLMQYANPDEMEPLFLNPPDWLEHQHTYKYGQVEVGLWKIMNRNS